MIRAFGEKGNVRTEGGNRDLFVQTMEEKIEKEQVLAVLLP